MNLFKRKKKDISNHSIGRVGAFIYANKNKSLSCQEWHLRLQPMCDNLLSQKAIDSYMFVEVHEDESTQETHCVLAACYCGNMYVYPFTYKQQDID